MDQDFNGCAADDSKEMMAFWGLSPCSIIIAVKYLTKPEFALMLPQLHIAY